MPYDGFGPGWSNSTSMKLRPRRAAERPASCRRRGRRPGTCCPSSRGSCVPCGVMPNTWLPVELALHDQRPLAGGRVHAIDVGRRAACNRGCSRACRVPTAHLPSGATSRSRIVSSASLTNRFAETSNAWRNVKLRSCSARIICSDWIRSSAVFHTSTSAASSVVLRVVSGAGDLLLDPEEHALVVLAPGERRAIADDPALGEAVRLRRIEHRPALTATPRPSGAAGDVRERDAGRCPSRASSRRRCP